MPDPSQSICINCGLCCDGTIFGKVLLAGSDDVAALERVGVVITTKDDRQSFEQPCAAFDGCACTVYATRPVKCGLYECALLRRLNHDEISFDEAAAIIAKTVKLRGVVRQAVEPFGRTDRRESVPELVKQMLDSFDALPDPAAAREEHSLILLYVASLDARLDRDFRNARPAVD